MNKIVKQIIGVLVFIVMSVSSVDAGILLTYPKFRATNDSGTALVSGKLYTYIAGTSTNKATYSDYNLATANANPVVLDRRGEATVYGAGAYKFVLKDSAGNTVWSVDNLTLATEQGDYAFYPNPGEADQNAVSTGGSITDILTALGTSKKATIVLYHNGAANTTTYTVASNADWSAYANATFKIVPGAVISHGAFTLNIPNPDAGPYQWLSGSGRVTFSGKIKEVYLEWFGGIADGVRDPPSGTDNYLPLYNAARSLPATGGKVQLLGKYVIGTTFDFDMKGEIWGLGYANTYGGVYPAGLIKKASLNGNLVTISHAGNALRNLVIDGQATNGGDGVQIAAERVVLEDLLISYQGGRGLRIGKASGSTLVNLWHLRNVNSRANTGDGIYVDDELASYDANSGVAIGCGSSANGGMGLQLENTSQNTFIGFDAESNTGWGVYIASGIAGMPDRNTFFGGTIEGNGGGAVYLGTTSTSNYLGFAYASGMVTDLGTDNHILIPGRTRTHGSVTLTLTGCTTSPTVAATYSRDGKQVSIFIPQIKGTSNTTAMTLTGLAALSVAGVNLIPAADTHFVAAVEDNSVIVVGQVKIDTNGNIVFAVGIGATAAFTGSGEKGIYHSLTLTYLVP